MFHLWLLFLASPRASFVAYHTNPTILVFKIILFPHLNSGTSFSSATTPTSPMVQKKHLIQSNNFGEAVWDHLHPFLAQNMTPLAQQINKSTPGRVCCPQK